MPLPLVPSFVAMMMFLAGGSSPNVRAAPHEWISVDEPCFISGELPATTIADDRDRSDSSRTHHFPGIPACEPLTVASEPESGKALLLARAGLPEWSISLSGDWSSRIHRTSEECKAILAARASISIQSRSLTRGPGTNTIDFVIGEVPGRRSIAEAVATYSPSWSLGQDGALWPQLGASVYIARSLPQVARLRDRMRIDRKFNSDKFSLPDTQPAAPLQSVPSRDLGHRSQPCAPLRIVEMTPDTLVVTELGTQSGNVQTYRYSAGAGWKEVAFRTQEECLSKLNERPLERHNEKADPLKPR